MTKNRWNRLYRRCVRVLRRTPDNMKQYAIKNRWLAWVGRQCPGTTCFFVPWN